MHTCDTVDHMKRWTLGWSQAQGSWEPGRPWVQPLMPIPWGVGPWPCLCH